MSRWSSVSVTAHYTGQVWVRQGLPWAELFDTGVGRALYAAGELLFAPARQAGFTTPPEFLVQRHLMLDALLTELAPSQLIELGAGLSPRALAFADAHGLPALDIDLPAMVQLKRRRLGPLAPTSYRALALDVLATEDFASALAPYLRCAAGNGSVVVITEGVIPYFPLDLQQRLFSRIASLLRHLGGGIYLTDVHHQKEVDRLGAFASTFRTVLSGLSRTRLPRMISDEAEGRERFAKAGFDALTLHRPAAFHAAVTLPRKQRDSGLAIYQATIA